MLELTRKFELIKDSQQSNICGYIDQKIGTRSKSQVVR